MNSLLLLKPSLTLTLTLSLSLPPTPPRYQMTLMSLLGPLRRICSGGTIRDSDIRVPDLEPQEQVVAANLTGGGGSTSIQAASALLMNNPNYDMISTEAECSICLDTMENPVITPCRHWFCRECILGWLSNKVRSYSSCLVVLPLLHVVAIVSHFTNVFSNFFHLSFCLIPKATCTLCRSTLLPTQLTAGVMPGCKKPEEKKAEGEGEGEGEGGEKKEGEEEEPPLAMCESKLRVLIQELR